MRRGSELRGAEDTGLRRLSCKDSELAGELPLALGGSDCGQADGCGSLGGWAWASVEANLGWAGRV